MNILLINQYAGSKLHGMEYRPYYLAREWVRQGHKVSIVAASFSHLRISNPKVTGWFTTSYEDGIRYIWLKTPSYSGNSYRRAVTLFIFTALIYVWSRTLADDSRFDVVIASSTHPLDIYPARHISASHNARLVFEVHDLWPLHLIEVGGFSRHHPLVRILQRAETFAYRHADVVISILPTAEAHMMSRGMLPSKLTVVPNGIVLDEWTNPPGALPVAMQVELDRLREKKPFLVGYAGAHGISNALDTLLKAAALLDDQPVAFVLVGQGPDKQALQEQAASLKLQNVLFLPAIARPFIPSFLAAMDVLYIGLKREPIFRFGISPNKLLDYMMAGRPVICAIEAGNDLVGESGCGLSIPAEDADALKAAVTELCAMDHRTRQDMGARGRSFVSERYDYRILSKRFIDAIAK